MKKPRFIFWLIKAFIQRHLSVVIVVAVASFLAILFGWHFSDLVRTLFFPRHTVLGVVGLYKPSTLPRFIQDKISVGLTQLNEKQEVIPAAASSWEVKDSGKTFVFKIRNELLWHDGKKLKASDVNYNFKDAEITPINHEVLKITLKEPYSPLPSLLSKPLFREGFVGLGTYKVKHIEWKGEYIRRIELEPLDPAADKPETIKFYPTLPQAITAFKLGEINTLQTIEPSAELQSWNRYLQIEENRGSNQYVTVLFNTDRPPFDQKQFRQALAYALPAEITGGELKSPIPTAYWAHNTLLKDIQYSEDKPLELLEKSGVATQSAEFTLHSFSHLLDTANELAAAWGKLGLNVKIKVINNVPEDYSALLTIQEIPRDPDQYPLWHSVQERTNVTNYKNPKIDKLLEDGRKAFNLEKRKELYDEFQRYIMDDLPALFLYHPTIYTFSRK